MLSKMKYSNMEQGLLVIFALLACIHALSTTLGDPCDPDYTNTWGGDNINLEYFCFDGQVWANECDKGHFYVKNATIVGCIPLEDIDSDCIDASLLNPGPCTAANMNQPQPSANPNNFFLCEQEGQPPVELTCNNSLAFVKQDGYLGCFSWDFWRKYHNC